MNDSIRVLHVDDDPAFAELVAEFLEREADCLEVLTETSASDGLDRLATDDIDCVVSDYNMPDRNGLAFLAAVRETHPDLPFILFTGQGSEMIASDAISAGVTDYLQKKGGTEQYELLANRIISAVKRFHAERRATKTEQRLRELADATDDILWVVSADWSDFRFVNDAYEDIWGRSREALDEDPTDFLQGIHPNDRDRVTTAMEQLSNGEPTDIEYRVNAAEDYQRWVWVKAEPIYNEDGDPVRIAGFARDITDRKAREQALKDERNFIDQALETLGDPFYVVGPDGELRRWNQRVSELTGYTDAELAEMQAIDLFAHDDRDRIRDAIAETLDKGHTTIEADVLTAAGNQIPHELTGSHLTDTEGTTSGLVGVGRDITEREQHERRLARLHEATRDLIVADTPDEVATIASEVANTILDLPMTGVHFYDDESEALIPVAVSEPIREMLDEVPALDAGIAWEVYQTGESRVIEDVSEVDNLYNPDTPMGSEIHLPLGDHGVFIVGSPDAEAFDEADITLIKLLAATTTSALDRTVHAQKLERLQRRTQFLMNTATVGATVDVAVDAANEILGAELSGFHHLVDEGQRLEPIAVSDSVPDIFDTPPSYDRATAADPVSSLVWKVYDAGKPRYIDDLITYPAVADQTPAGSAIVYPIPDHGVFIVSWSDSDAFTDLDRKLADILASTLTTALHRVERESLLRERREELEHKNDRLEEFTDIISHDLRSPLNVAQGRLEMAREECDSDHLDTVATAQERMVTLIDDLLALAREGKPVAETTLVSLADIADTCWRNVETADATLVTETDCRVRADQGRLQQLVANLFRNAIDHGGDDVTVTVGELDDGFYVADDGHGIPDGADDVFAYGFSTADNGTGFGLAIVQEIVDSHDWDVTVDENVDGGARFEITGVDCVT